MRRRVLGVTVLGLFVFAAGGAWMYSLLWWQAGQYERILRCFFPFERKLGELRVLLEQQRALIATFMARPVPAVRAEFEQVSARLRAALAEKPMAEWAESDAAAAAIEAQYEQVRLACMRCAGLHERLLGELAARRLAQATATMAELPRHVATLLAAMDRLTQELRAETRAAEQQASAAQSRLQRIFMGAMLAAVLSGMLANVALYRWLLPLKGMVDAVRRVGRGDTSVHVPVKGGDELSYLGVEFNSMATALTAHVQALAREQEVLRATFDGIRESLVVHDVEGRVLHANPAAGALAAARRQAAPACYCTLLDLEAPCPGPAGPDAAADRLVVADEASGNSYEVSRQSVHDERGGVRLVVEFIRDITDTLRAERERRQNEKLSAVGSVALGVAHEVRNPLSTIQTTLHGLNRRSDLRPPERERIDLALREVDRLDRLVDALLRYGRPSAPDLRVLQVADLLRQSLELVRGESARYGVEIVIDEPLPEPPEIEGDRDQLMQVFLNLYENAMQASPAGSRVRVAAEFRPGWRGRGATSVSVTDVGHGIDARHLENVLTPFFTTREEGTGLGLAIAHRIVESHGGELTLESRPDRGTTARVWLPARGAGRGPAAPGA